MVVGYVGFPRSGKTYQATAALLEQIKQGRRAFANYDVKGAHRFTELQDILLIEDADINIDEINLICPSRYFQKLPPSVASYWAQSGKGGLTMRWTAQDLARVDTIVREITEYIWVCKKVFYKWHQAICYTPGQLQRVEAGQEVEPLEVNNFWISPKIHEQYNTFQRINPAKLLKELEKADFIPNANPNALPIITDIAEMTQAEKDRLNRLRGFYFPPRKEPAGAVTESGK